MTLRAKASEMVRCTAEDDASCDPFEFEVEDEPSNHGIPVYEGHNKIPKGTVSSPPPSSMVSGLVNGRSQAREPNPIPTDLAFPFLRYQLGSTIGKGNDGTVRQRRTWP